MITDPYLDALTKETRARTRNRLTVSIDQDIAEVPMVHNYRLNGWVDNWIIGSRDRVVETCIGLIEGCSIHPK